MSIKQQQQPKIYKKKKIKNKKQKIKRLTKRMHSQLVCSVCYIRNPIAVWLVIIIHIASSAYIETFTRMADLSICEGAVIKNNKQTNKMKK